MLQDYNKWGVLQVFFNRPSKEHYLKEISRKADLAHTSVKNYLKELVEEDIIKEEEEQRGSRTYPLYKANLQSQKYKFYKKIDILQRLRDTNLIQHIKDECQPDTIVLFGSASRGEDTEESDIDLYIQSEEKGINLKKFENKLQRDIQLHFQPNFKDYPKELQNNIINGIKIQGYLNAIR